MFRSASGAAAFFCCLASLLTLPAAQANPFLPVPPASFLDYHVDTVHQLTEQVHLDPAVCARLARYFHRTGPQIAAYLQDNLTPTRLPRAGRYRMACVTTSGREYWVSERLAAGTPVFALRGTGQPILRLACGNPLVKTLPVVHKPAPPRPAALIKTPPYVAVLTPALLAPDTVVFSPTDALIGPGDATVGPLVLVGSSLQTAGGGGHGGSFLSFLGLLPFLPHGGGHSSSPPVPVAPVIPGMPVAAPEPSPLLFFAVAGLGIATLTATFKVRRLNGGNGN